MKSEKNIVNNIAHKTFLIFMFYVCAIAVICFVQKNVNASTSTPSTRIVSEINATVPSTTTPVPGVCSEINGQTLISKPLADKGCKSGTASAVIETIEGWSWKCMGINSFTFQQCGAIRKVELSPASQPASTPSTRVSAVQEKTITATNKTSMKKTVDISNEESKEIQPASTVITTSENLQVAKDQISTTNQKMGDPALLKSVKRSEIIKAPVIVSARNLSKENNPRISGVVSESLKVENVELNKHESGENNVVLNGRADPNSLITIYIFSSDPVVITIKADVDGTWNYELDRELADGQHEAYVAMINEGGKISSKSEPIAFVKTAQAASVIPMSEFTGNESPIERSTQQYVLMAIIIMSVCLAIALILMGFLSHKQNVDERIN